MGGNEQWEDLDHHCADCGSVGEVLVMGDWVTCPSCNGGAPPVIPAEVVMEVLEDEI
jgi:hypothetical protein